MRQRERAQSVESSHYIARVLTKDWRTEYGKLRFYDFTTGQCGSDPASALFVASEPWGDEVEKWLNHNIETPLGLFVKNRWSLEECREKTVLALVATLLLQVIRTAEDAEFLRKLAASGDGELRGLAGMFFANHDLRIRRAGEGDLWLSYPSDGYIMFPTILGCGWAQSISNDTLLAAVPKGLPSDDKIPSSALAALSVGWISDRVVLPPMWEPEPAALAQYMADMRRDSKSLASLILEIGREGGLTTQTLAREGQAARRFRTR
jgi:hypothetical protein